MQTNLLKPKAIHVEPLGNHRAKVTLEPFERGYGHTLGNALRRVLLSSMVGYAPTEVTIAGVLHEYSTIDGVAEDVVHIMLNLKGVVFRLHNRDEVTLVVRKEGEGPVTAADIQVPHDVEIINPEHVIAHLAQGGKLDMQIKVEKGRGYVPGTMRRYGDEPTKSIGRIVLDASFSPVKRVSYTVESARVEQRTDLDKLVVEIETHGAISAEDAVRSEMDFLIRIFDEVIKAGATTLNVPDTVGYSIPSLWGERMKQLIERVPNADKVIWSASTFAFLPLSSTTAPLSLTIGTLHHIIH